MILRFDQVRGSVLIALHRLLYENDENEFFSLEEIKVAANLDVGSAYLGKILNQLELDDLSDSSFYEDEASHRYTLTADGIIAAEKVIDSLQRSDDNPPGVPASDRVVTLGDNWREAVQRDLAFIAHELEVSNEAGAALGDERERVAEELKAGSSLVSVKRVRLEALLGVLATPLRYLAEKFSGAAIGELAKKLLGELWKVLAS